MHASGLRSSNVRRLLRWRRAPFLALPLLAVGVAACGSSAPGAGASGPPPGSPRTVVLTAAQRTESANTATIALHMTISGTPDLGSLLPGGSTTKQEPVSVSIDGTGAFDFVHKSGTLNMTIASSKTGSATVEILIIGNDLYLHAAQLPALDGGKPWIHVDASTYAKGQGQNSGALGGFQGGDPTKVLDMLQKLTGNVTQVGPAQIDGVPTTEYRGTVDLTGSQSGTGSSAFGQR
ncbi:MAG TPA: hypothetical protein VKR22_07765, partial [Acidimicrobiales bacterium]|nr:hypothetical protein [Acidimicrobiales bacterium]